MLGRASRLRLRAAHEGLPRRARARRDLRAPARAVRLLERGRADGGARRARRCSGSARGATGHGARHRARLPGARRCCSSRCCWPTRAASLLALGVGLRASGSRSCRCACAASPCCAAARLGGALVGAVGVRPGRPHRGRRRRSPQRADAGHELGVAARARARRAARGRPARRVRAPPTRAPSPRDAPRRGRRVLVVRSRSCRSRSPARSRRRARPRRARSPSGWKRADRPEREHADQRPEPPDRVGSVRARYWRRRAKIFARTKRASASARAATRPRGCASATTTLDVRHAHGYVVQTLADLGLVGLALSLALLARVARGGRAARPGCGGRDAARPYDARSGIGLLTLVARRRRLRRALARRLDVVRPRHRGAGAAVRRLGRRAAARGRPARPRRRARAARAAGRAPGDAAPSPRWRSPCSAAWSAFQPQRSRERPTTRSRPRGRRPDDARRLDVRPATLDPLSLDAALRRRDDRDRRGPAGRRARCLRAGRRCSPERRSLGCAWRTSRSTRRPQTALGPSARALPRSALSGRPAALAGVQPRRGPAPRRRRRGARGRRQEEAHVASSLRRDADYFTSVPPIARKCSGSRRGAPDLLPGGGPALTSTRSNPAAKSAPVSPARFGAHQFVFGSFTSSAPGKNRHSGSCSNPAIHRRLGLLTIATSARQPPRAVARPRNGSSMWYSTPR